MLGENIPMRSFMAMLCSINGREEKCLKNFGKKTEVLMRVKG
jgi:hypothetical protein